MNFLRIVITRLDKRTINKLACNPLLPNCFTATSSFLCGFSELLMTHLYTHPKPPSPILTARSKFFVAVLSSESVNNLRLLGFWVKLGNELLPCWLWACVWCTCVVISDPDLLVLRSVRVDLRSDSIWIFCSSAHPSFLQSRTGNTS